MIRFYFRRLCVLAVLFMLIFMLAHQRTNISIKTNTVTPLNPNKTDHTNGIVLRTPSSRFFVFSPQCKIPYVDPFAKELLKWEPLKVDPCSDGPSLFSVTYDRNRRHYRVHLNKSVADNHFASFSPFGCTYIEINPGPHLLSAHSKPINFNPDWMVPNHILGVIVECHAISDTSRVMQRDAFSFVQHPRQRNERNNTRRDAMKPSIFLFGIDSMSRMNFQRTMPLTSKFVHQEGWFEMKGYSTLGNSKIINLLAILTSWHGKPLCDLQNPSCLYGLTFLWQYFNHAGYQTAYAEDETHDYFHQLKTDDPRSMVDFYMRPFLVVVEKVFKTMENLGFCLGRKHRFSYVFDFAQQLIERFVFEQARPLFGIFWTSSFTRDDFRGGGVLDMPFVRYLEKFKEYGLFDRSIVILLSDHGSRQGLLVDHPTGFLEERLPMLHIYLPPWYQKRFPSVVKALQLNTNRLSSNCDLHLGLLQFIKQARPGITFMNAYHTCHSILEELPKDRSCTDALIPPKLCACEPFLRLPITDDVRNIASLVVYRMNKYLRLLNLAKDCYRLVLNRVLQADRQLRFDKRGNIVDLVGGFGNYRLVFTIKPNDTRYWSMVHSSNATDVVTIQLEMIRRLDPHSIEPYCAKDAMAKRFCICR